MTNPKLNRELLADVEEMIGHTVTGVTEYDNLVCVFLGDDKAIVFESFAEYDESKMRVLTDFVYASDALYLQLCTEEEFKSYQKQQVRTWEDRERAEYERLKQKFGDTE